MQKIDLNHKSVLITGGTGSFGKKFVDTIIKKSPDIKRLIIFSRDELKQFEMAQNYQNNHCIRFFIGDIRDEQRFMKACEDIDVIVHAAALKQVPAAEYNPSEFIKTNILGAENVINAALKHNVEKVVALSTDKAAAPINLYGATKLCSDKLFVTANNIKGKRQTVFSVVRYGNVLGSRGSVIPFFLNKRKEGIIPITHPEMTRFNITLEEGVDLVLFALDKALGGEIFVPKIPSYRITEVAEAVAPECKIKIIGIRSGEKIHEEMITESDSLNTIETDEYYIIVPNMPKYLENFSKEEFINHYKAKNVSDRFKYNSGTNSDWLNVRQLRELIRKHVDINFEI